MIDKPFQLYNYDCLLVLTALPDNSIDAIVTDPPYGLEFMGKGWDKAVPPVDIWAECLRVLKPGGHLLAFAGTRTQHRMATNIEDAGFEIRDLLAWVYGSGFPKSVNISKEVDKKLGAKPKIVGEYDRRSLYDMAHRTSEGDTGDSQCAGRSSRVIVTEPATEEAAKWLGWGSALKPAFEPITMARKPFKGTLTSNVMAFGTGGLNIDACRVPTGEKAVKDSVKLDNNRDNANINFGMKRIPYESDEKGRWPANLMHDGSSEVVELFPNKAGARANVKGSEPSAAGNGRTLNPMERVAFARELDTGSAARFFYCPKASKADRDWGLNKNVVSAEEMVNRKAGSAGIQNPRAGAGRTSGAMNFHPTVKPIALMQWLTRLITPVGGTILDPFMGSGSTGIAAMREGFRFLGCELDPEYFQIAAARLKAAEAENKDK